MRGIFAISLLIGLFNCGSKPAEVRDGGEDRFLTRLHTPGDVSSIQTSTVDQSYSGASEVKVVYDIKKDALYFVNGKLYTFHIDFCSSVLGYWLGNYTFNKSQYYENKNRQFLLGKLLKFNDSETWVLEFISSDMVKAEQVALLLDKVKAACYFGEEIRVLVHREQLFQELLESSIPAISENDLFKGLQYQAVNFGYTFGYIKIIDVKDIGQTYISQTDIIVVNGTPNDIPPVAGMITAQFQTPLSHISLLCRNRKTPLAAYKLIENLHLEKYKDVPVKFSVSLDSISIERADKAELETFWSKRETSKGMKLKIDTIGRGILMMKEITSQSYPMVGAKAANFGSLQRALQYNKSKAKTPEGAFAIPIAHYFNHLRKNGTRHFIKMQLEKIKAGGNLDTALAQIRQLIESTEIDGELVAAIEAQVLQYPEYDKWRFRSSTNAEDLSVFNGAGLYDSKSADLKSKKKTIEYAVKQVWASCWNKRAFLERNYYGIKHMSVGMGVLVHRSFPNEKANGVIISKNIYDHYNPGIVINVQIGENSVVSPDSGVVCEQIVYQAEDWFSSSSIGIQYLSKSSITNGENILTSDQLKELAKSVEEVKKYFFENVSVDWKGNQTDSYGFGHLLNPSDYFDFALDIEFKIDGENETIYLKQVRPYN